MDTEKFIFFVKLAEKIALGPCLQEGSKVCAEKTDCPLVHAVNI
jgi:hypothetical protein